MARKINSGASEKTIDSLFYKQIREISTKVKILCLVAIAAIIFAAYFLPRYRRAIIIFIVVMLTFSETWFLLWKTKAAKMSGKRYIKSSKGYIFGLTYRDVAKGLDDNLLISAIKRMRFCKKAMFFIAVISIVAIICGFKIDYEPLWGPGIALGIASVGLFILALHNLPIYIAEKNKRKL